jgi:hypothetical protein
MLSGDKATCLPNLHEDAVPLFHAAEYAFRETMRDCVS